MTRCVKKILDYPADLVEAVRKQLELERQAEEAKLGRFWSIAYDVPVDSDIPNPSPWFRPWAIRWTLSCWIVPEHLLDSLRETIAWMLRHKCRVRQLEFATSPHNQSELLKQAEESIRAQISEAQQSLAQTELEVSRELLESDGSEQAQRKARNRLRTALRRLNEVLSDLERAAAGFAEGGLDITSALTPLDEARRDALGLQAEQDARTVIYAEAAKKARDKGLRVGAPPAEILADALEDVGEDASTLRRAFRRRKK